MTVLRIGKEYAKTFLRQMETCPGTALDKRVALVTNAGGLNPAGLAEKLSPGLLSALLGAGGVAASTRFYPQAMLLGEWLRSRVVDVPEAVRVAGGEPLVSEVATTGNQTGNQLGV